MEYRAYGMPNSYNRTLHLRFEKDTLGFFWLFPRISYHRLESTTNFMQILRKDEGYLKLIRDTIVIKNIWEVC